MKTDGQGSSPTWRDLAWIASALSHPEDLRELGLPLNGALSPAGRRALEAIRELGAVQGVLRDPGGMTVDAATQVMRIIDRGVLPYGEMLRAAVAANPTATGLLSAAEIFAPLPPISWLCQAFDVAPGAPILIAGYGYSGKTVAAQDLALAVATGTNAWGRFPVRTGRVLHLDYEQGSYLDRLRYQRLAAARGIDPRSLDGRLVLSPMPGWYIDDDDRDDELARLADGFDLGIVDSFRAACPRTDENSSDARVPLDRLTRISEKTGTTWLVIHHARKPSQNATGGARMAVRGSGALYDACGSVLVFAAEKGDPVTVEHEKARITGRTHEPFQLWIEDVATDAGPKGGLRVSALDGAPATKQTPSQRLQEVQARVLEFVRDQGGTAGGNNVIAQHLGGKKETLNVAISELVRTGRLEKGGTTKEPTLSIPGTT